jgi:hypothetical protein
MKDKNAQSGISLAHYSAMPIVNLLRCRHKFVLVFMVIIMAPWQPAGAQYASNPAEAGNAPLTAERVVNNLVRMNRDRQEALQAYQGTRIYRVNYKGFTGSRSAEMIVDMKYQFPEGKVFTVQSATGSKLIIDKVFKKLLEAEKEAQGTEAQRRTALNSDNYAFRLIGYEKSSAGPMYVLDVEPRRKDKFLYRGRIWVNAEEFAVVRLQAEPAKNPSFWTKRSKILQVYSKVNDFWLPTFNESVSDIRLGGHAELTIQYQRYEVKGDSVENLTTTRSGRSAGALLDLEAIAARTPISANARE